eukprot:gene1830-2501_t
MPANAQRYLVDAVQLHDLQQRDLSVCPKAPHVIANSADATRFSAIAQPLGAPACEGEYLAAAEKITIAEDAACMLRLALMFGTLLWIPVCLLLLLLSFPAMQATAIFACGIGLLMIVQPKGAHWPPARGPPALRRRFYRYFSLKLVMPGPEAFVPGRQYIFAGAPHGVFPLGDLLSCLLAPLGHIHGLAAPAALRVPFYGDLLRWAGMVECGKKNVMRLMHENGRSVG